MVWKKSKQQYLMDSITRGYDISNVIMWVKEDGTWECLDGQQRLRSIFDFIENKYPFSERYSGEQLGGKRFSELHEDIQVGKIWTYNITTTSIFNADEKTASDIFLRVQEGLPLNAAEKLHAMRGEMSDLVSELSNHAFLRRTKISEYRFGYEYVCAQICHLEINGFLSLIFVDAKFKNLRSIYEQFKGVRPPASLRRRVKRTFNFIQRSLRRDANIIRKRSDFVSIFLLVSYCLEKYALSGRKDNFREFVIRFLRDVESSREGTPYYEYFIARKEAPDSGKNIKKRFDVVLGKFLEFTPDMPQKDPQRSFDFGQKLAIYFRDGGKCLSCGRIKTIDEMEAHHKIFWERGGPTTVENGQLLCVDCHRGLSRSS